MNDRGCGAQCAAFAIDGDEGVVSCTDSTGCRACAVKNGIYARYQQVAGRTFVNSGYPSGLAAKCSAIASTDVVDQSDICSTVAAKPTPTAAPAPTNAPVKPPTNAPVKPPTNAPVKPPTNAPVSAAMQACMEDAQLEVSLSGNTIVCDCTAAGTGQTIVPLCYNSPDRTQEQICATQYETCSRSSDCCSADTGKRTCRRGQCRSVGRSFLKGDLRLFDNKIRSYRNRAESDAVVNGGAGRRRIRGVSKK